MRATSASPPRPAAENAEAARFLDVFMFRRYLAKLRFELDFWSRFGEDGGTAGGYAERADRRRPGLVYRADRYLADMDSGFYSADYLRAWIRSAQLRAYLRSERRRGLVAPPGDRRVPARALPRGPCGPRTRRSRAASASTPSTSGRSSPSRRPPERLLAEADPAPRAPSGAARRESGADAAHSPRTVTHPMQKMVCDAQMSDSARGPWCGGRWRNCLEASPHRDPARL